MPQGKSVTPLWGTDALLARIREAAERVARPIPGLGADDVERDLRASAATTPHVAAALVGQALGLTSPTVAPPPYARRDLDDFADSLARLLRERDRLGAALRETALLKEERPDDAASIAALHEIVRAASPASAIRGTDVDRFLAVDEALSRMRTACSIDSVDRLVDGHESHLARQRRLGLYAHEQVRAALVQLRADILLGASRPFLDGWPTNPTSSRLAKDAVLACVAFTEAQRPGPGTLYAKVSRVHRRLSAAIDDGAFRKQLRRAGGALDAAARRALATAGIVVPDTLAKWKRAERRTDAVRSQRAKTVRGRQLGATGGRRVGKSRSDG